MLYLLDVVEELAVDCLLGGLEFLLELALSCLSGLNLLQPVLRGVFELVLAEPSALLEEGVVDVDVDAIEGDLGGSREDVGGVDSAEGDSVDCVWAGDEEVSRGEFVENDDSSSSVGAGKEDDYGPSLDGLPSG